MVTLNLSIFMLKSEIIFLLVNNNAGGVMASGRNKSRIGDAKIEVLYQTRINELDKLVFSMLVRH